MHIKFKEYIAEQKNLHMEHMEDFVLNAGVEGTRSAINYLRAVRDMLAGHSEKKVSITVKWDGAPAVFAGKDPSDGKFFVAKKGIFNKNPKLYKTNAEIDSDTSGDLAEKLKACLAHLPKLGITNVIQGDLLFTSSDIKNATIDGDEYITFHPNTIVYAIPAKSILAKEIKRAKIGIVWHTFYEGTTLEDMKAVFGKDILSTLTKSADVWSTDVNYKDVSGKATMTANETKEITDILSEAGRIFYRIDPKILNGISDNEELLMKIKTFNNTKVRAQEKINNPSRHVGELIDYLKTQYQKDEESKKTEKGKQAVREKSSGVLGFFTTKAKRDLVNIFTVMNLLVDAKKILISKLDEVKNLHTFLLTKDGYKVTGVEGYVAIDHLSGNAVKLVDRLQFSYANFSPDIIKGWQR
jgi:hypothetical protein